MAMFLFLLILSALLNPLILAASIANGLVFRAWYYVIIVAMGIGSLLGMLLAHGANLTLIAYIAASIIVSGLTFVIRRMLGTRNLPA